MLCSPTGVESSIGSWVLVQALGSVPAAHRLPTILSHDKPMSTIFPASTSSAHHGVMWSTRSTGKEKVRSITKSIIYKYYNITDNNFMMRLRGYIHTSHHYTMVFILLFLFTMNLWTGEHQQKYLCWALCSHCHYHLVQVIQIIY